MVTLTTTYGDIAADSYETTSNSDLDGWTRIDTDTRSNTNTGFVGTIYQNDSNPGEYIISYRGTDDFSDVTSDSQIINGNIPDQLNDAREFYFDMVDNYGTNITLTGHSLGGGLASLVAAENGISATVFNALGVQNVLDNYGGLLGLDPNGNYSDISNFNALGDPAKIFGQIGNITTILVDSFPLLPDWFEPFAALFFPHLLPYYLLDQHGLDDLIDAIYSAAEAWQPRRDPLSFDLDRDGIETLSVDGGGVNFDHEGDGIKELTGWIAPDDGFLVYDRNGNGLIDDGSELFGDSTPLNAGGTATNGFEALADFDTNADGVVNSSDTNFNDLRIWQDINSDGISQAEELLTLQGLDIASINTDYSNTNSVQNGNVISAAGSYTYTDGTSSTVGSATSLVDLDLAVSTFNSTFTTSIPLTPTAELLPNMNGSGAVRNLQEAASLDSNLSNVISTYASATTRDQQQAQLDNLIQNWGDTSTLQTVVDAALAAGYIPTFTFGSEVSNTANETLIKSTYENTTVVDANAMFDLYNSGQDALYIDWVNRLEVLEQFNGRQLLDFVEPVTAPSVFITVLDGNGVPVEYRTIDFNFSTQRIDLLTQSYDALRNSAYEGLLGQTRLKPYLDSIGINVDTTGDVTYDFSSMETLLSSAIATNEIDGIADTFDLLFFQSGLLNGMEWSGFAFLGNALETATNTSEIQALLNEMDVIYAGFDAAGAANGTDVSDTIIGTQIADILSGGLGNDIIFGGDGGDTINGTSGTNVLFGGNGNDIITGGVSGIDQLYGEAGDDTISGGVGSASVGSESRGDDFHGGTGNDTLVSNANGSYGTADHYYFNVGDGQDTITDFGSSTSTYTDKIILGPGITPADVSFTHNAGEDLIINFANGTDQITITDWYSTDSYRIENVVFADGTVLDVATIDAGGLDIYGTAGNDTMTGITSELEQFYGGAGDDTISGGVGSASVGSESRGDDFHGGTGNDILVSNANGSYGTADHYYFNVGDGQDTITDFGSSTSTYADKIILGPGITPADVSFTQLGDDLVIDFIGGTDRITVTNWYVSSSNRIENLAFSDGQVFALNSLQLGDSLDNVLTGGTLSDVITGGDGVDTISGNDGNDLIFGGLGNDVINGDNGDDHLIGGDGHDVLYGGLGLDTLIGGLGNDNYLIDRYDQNTTIFDASGVDTIQFGEGISVSDIETLYSANGDLKFKVNGIDSQFGEDVVTINDWLDGNKIEQFEFFDGVVMTADDMVASRTYTVEVDASIGLYSTVVFNPFSGWLSNHGGTEGINYGTDNDDILKGGSFTSDVIDGKAGSDRIFGLAGDDIIHGGSGNDYIVGDYGNDTLYGNENDDVIFGGEGDDILNGGSNADIMVGGRGDDSYVIDEIGDVVTELLGEGVDTVNSSIAYTLTPNIENLILTGVDDINGTGNDYDNNLTGNSGNNTLNGGSGDDELYGEKGDDRLHGGLGNDTYYIQRNDGVDHIRDTGGDDVIQFGESISHDQLWFMQEGNKLIINVIGEEDSLTIDHWFNKSDRVIEEISTDDGYSLSFNEVDQLVQAMSSFNPPEIGQYDLTSNLESDLKPVINETWQIA